MSWGYDNAIKRKIFLVGEPVTRTSMGLSRLWLSVLAWLSLVPAGIISTEPATIRLEQKNPEVPLLADYKSEPKPEFWEHFPNSKGFFKTGSAINYRRFRRYVNRCWVGWNIHQRAVAKRALKNIRRGAYTQLTKVLKSQRCKNAKLAEVFGEQMTDTLASWVKKGFVAGPFDRWPLKNFRVNLLMAVAQPTKIRPIMNLSAPTGSSFNESVNTLNLTKLRMSSPKIVGESILKLGGRG